MAGFFIINNLFFQKVNNKDITQNLFSSDFLSFKHNGPAIEPACCAGILPLEMLSGPGTLTGLSD